MSKLEPLRLGMFVMPADWAVARNVFVAHSSDNVRRLARSNSLGSFGWIKRVLDSGAEGIILPRAYLAQEVAEFVSACRYPPLGTRGFGPRRPMHYGRLGQAEYLQQANRDVFVTVQVETVELLAELDEVLKLEGLDSLVHGCGVCFPSPQTARTSRTTWP
jgi:4-hydroxy-2-oxoheptanedioate aldolase